MVKKPEKEESDMAARDVVLKPITEEKVAEKIEKALSATRKKEEALKKEKENIAKEGFIFKK